MSTSVTVTGTGVPPVCPGRAGSGVLVRHADLALQFDAGRSTTLRLADVGVLPAELDAVFITHHHSDHIMGVVDLVYAAWVNRPISVNLSFVAPSGPAVRFLERMLDPFEDDLEVRTRHSARAWPQPRISSFEATADPTEVWARGDVRVLARTVHHQPVEPAVCYRIETPDGAIVISGDTRVCDEVEELATGCDVLVHEAFRVDAFVEETGDPSARVLGNYHSDVTLLGAMVARAAPGHLMLTHLVPQPRTDEAKAAFVADLEAGGYKGPVTVCDDLDSFTFGD